MVPRALILALALALPGPAHAARPEAVARGAPPAALSAWGLFTDRAATTPAAGVEPYALVTPLFSDHAEKDRFLYLPPGTAARYDAAAAFEFPVGAVLVKTFSLPADLRDPASPRRKLETRLLVRQEAGWRAFPYVWDADGREARLAVAGKEIPVSITLKDGATRAFVWTAPNMNQCKGCHALDEAVTPIGPKAANLHFAGQLEGWLARGRLDRLPADAPRAVDASAPLDARARAYLDVNCAHCHNPKGPASNSGLDLRRTQADPHAFGVGKRPIAAGRGSGGHKVSIAPGAPDASILAYRMASEDPGVMMPELGRSLVDAEGLALIRQWIAEME